MNEQLKWISDALNWLLQNGRINSDQYYVFLNYYQTQINNFELVQRELTQMYQQNNPSFIEQKYNYIINIDNIEIIEEVGELEPTGITMSTNPNNEPTGITMSEGGKQKTLGTHPQYKKAGFMNMLLFIFLTGISSGIILMIILNLLVK